MRTDHIYGHRNNRQMRVAQVAVLMSAVGTVTASIVREDGRSLQLYMTAEEAQSLAAQLAGVSVADALERDPRLAQHDAVVETVHGVAQVEYLGNGRYRVADGAAVVIRHATGHNGLHWTVEGSRARYASRLAAVTHIMENL